MVEYDNNKNATNLTKHGLSLELVRFFDWQTAWTKEDVRRDYGERRYVSTGFIADRLHALVWTARSEEIRPISLRKANKRERKAYEKRIY